MDSKERVSRNVLEEKPAGKRSRTAMKYGKKRGKKGMKILTMDRGVW